MQRAYAFLLPGGCWRKLALVGLLGSACTAEAQTTNTGPVYNGGNLYHGGAFTNAAPGTFTNFGTVFYAGPSAATFANSGAYAAASGGTDQFIGPAGAAGTQELAGTAAANFYNLLLANGSAALFVVSNPAGIDVANTLTLANGITTTTGTTTPTAAANTVTGAIRLGSGATVSGAFGPARYVDGYVGKAGTSTFTFPLGATNQTGGNTTAVGAAVYSPLTFSSPGGTAARYVATTPPNHTVLATQAGAQQLTVVSSHEYYPVGVGSVPAGTAITIPYGTFGPSAAGTPYVTDPSTLTIAAYDGVRWTNLATTVGIPNTTTKTVTVTLPATLSTGFTALALASTSAANPLPVELVRFTAVKKGTDGQLHWQTASEIHSAYFEVQASADSRTWQVLRQVAAAGSSSAFHSYDYVDREITRYGVPLVYYRLRQVDLTGMGYYSPVVTLAPGAAAWQLSAYPNPFETDLTVNLTTPEAGLVALTLFDALGHTVLRCELAGTPGRNVFALDQARALATGTYTLLVRQNGHTGTVRLVRR